MKVTDVGGARKAKEPAGRRRYEDDVRNNSKAKTDGCPVPQTGTGRYKVRVKSKVKSESKDKIEVKGARLEKQVAATKSAAKSKSTAKAKAPS